MMETLDDISGATRYKAIGNSWAVPIIRWISERINYVRSL